MTDPLRGYVVGIDPSLTATGVADWRGKTSVHGGGAGLGDIRLDTISRAVADAVRFPVLNLDGILAVLEDLPINAYGAGYTGMAQGVVRLGLIDMGVAYVVMPAATLKKYATGNGAASKSDMRMALYKRAGLDLRDDNQVDAWWLRQAGLDAVGHPDAITMPKAQREALLKVAWPEDIAARLLEPYETPAEVS